MQRIYQIKSSQTWTCPKAGTWRVICVGGGASGGLTFHQNVIALQSAGGTTSFGNLLSAPGGAIETTCTIGAKSCGGYGGYDGVNYGGNPMVILRPSTYSTSSTTLDISASLGPSLNGGTLGSPGLGYGAGGGVGLIITINTKNGDSASISNIYAVPGKCGSMAMGIFDLALNQSISCTIGTSAKPSSTASTLIQQFKKSSPNITEIVASEVNKAASAVTAGTSGVIYIEYIG